jgi:putative transposase
MGEKKIVGRKRHILVDTEGNLLTVVVHRADMQERDGAYFVLEDVEHTFPHVEKIWADQAYTGDLLEDVRQQYGITLEIVKKLADQEGLVVLPRRWVVERTFAWLCRYRRLSKDYEHRVEYSESWVYIASIARMLRTLHPNKMEERPYSRKKSPATKDIMMPLYT